MKPAFKVIMAGVNITSKIKDRLLSLTVNDAAGVKSDTVRIELDDRDSRIIEPPDGAPIIVFMGYGRFLVPMGVFVLDKVEYEIAPDRMIIHGKAADMGGSIKDQKTRNWDDKTIEEIVTTIAAEHGLEPKVAERFKAVKYDYLAQKAESDINFLSRIGKDHDAIVSVKQMPKAGGSGKSSLLFIGKGEGKASSGRVLPQIWVFKTQLLPGSRVSKNKSSIYKSVKATWHDKGKGEKESVTVGKGSPVFEITHPHQSKAAAERAAQAKLDEQARLGHSMSLTLLGNPIHRAEGQLVAIGFRLGIPALWSIKSVAHRLTSGGYTTQIECELPKSH